ncbi:receptor kinase-like protein Xa21 [Cryptomeria japonica]|uniref:receptor kinase-like protein Xa21 n=1 Tax=Cryptomeria japonica TaxID=3369 RepID=UPI0027D9D4DB|nr:receptor kinase-like protein Xa21 [Cryptomeria japonica]
MEQPSIEFQHPRISYKELSTSTSGFGKGNLLGVGGVGSVYKGFLDNRILIVVKALDLENEAAHKSFSIECQVLSKDKHRNIIKIITSCSNLDFKGLVFEFMPSRSLEEHLHCDAGKFNIGSVCKMNLQTRLQIAKDIACGLVYLHHDCSIQVVHYDLKPNNVLLDFYMAAHIADFGNTNILSEGQGSVHSLSTSTTLKGGLGYIAPRNVEQPSIEFPHPRISHKELSTATNVFGKGNLLGAGAFGSIYKGVLDYGTLIAVNTLNLEDEAAHKSFSIECLSAQ